MAPQVFNELDNDSVEKEQEAKILDAGEQKSSMLGNAVISDYFQAPSKELSRAERLDQLAKDQERMKTWVARSSSEIQSKILKNEDK